MGVSGSGKTTIATRLAELLRWALAEGDSFHSPANVARMRSGIALTDQDRWPWLDAMAAWIDSEHASGHSCVITCSALKRVYRERLRGGHGDVRFVFLKGEHGVVAGRMAARMGHYMPLALLQSQFDALEEPASDENALVVSIDSEPDRIVAEIVAALGLAARD